MTNIMHPVKMGIDVGSRIFRVAYVFPDEEQAVVTIPISLDMFRPYFPITETMPTNDLYAGRFFPGFTQRLDREIYLNFSGAAKRSIWEIATDIIKQVLDASESFAGTTISGLLMAVPVWEPEKARTALVESMSRAGVENGKLCSVTEAVAAYFQGKFMSCSDRATVLSVSAGYAGMSAAVIRLTPRGVRVLAQDGDEEILAGNIINYRLMYSAFSCLRKAGVGLINVRNPVAWTLLSEDVEVAKETAAQKQHASFLLPAQLLLGHEQPLEFVINNEVLTEVYKEHAERALELCSNVLVDANVPKEEIDYVLMHGGSTYFPSVPLQFEKFFPAATIRHMPPEAVCNGAARLAAISWEDLSIEVGQVSSQEFYPSLEAVEGLVEFKERLSSVSEEDNKPGEKDNNELSTDNSCVASVQLPPIDRLSITEILAIEDRRRQKEEIVRLLRQLGESALKTADEMEKDIT
jgi:hypothetical protein